MLEVTRLIVQVKATDNNEGWGWPEEVIVQMQAWFRQKQLPFGDAIRVMDRDFDGFVGLEDLRSFLTEVLHVNPTEISKHRLSRLFTLMDKFKAGRLEEVDIERVLLPGERAGFDTVLGQVLK